MRKRLHPESDQAESASSTLLSIVLTNIRLNVLNNEASSLGTVETMPRSQRETARDSRRGVKCTAFAFFLQVDKLLAALFLLVGHSSTAKAHDYDA